MALTIQANVFCTIDDEFHLLEVARGLVRAVKRQEDWELFYPASPTDALQIIIREAIAARLLACDGVTLHEIGHKVLSDDLRIGL